MKSPHIDADLQALRRTTARDLPDLAATRRMLIEEGLRSRRGEPAMLMILRSRPKLTALVGTLALAAALVVVPIPYSRTVGYEVAIDVAGKRETAERVQRELGRSLRAEETRVVARQGGFRVTARARGASRQAAEGTARAFVGSLAKRGITAHTEVSPVVARVSGNVYAMARDTVLRLDIDEDDSPEEIEAAVRAQLEAGGFSGDVTVERADGKTFVLLNGADTANLGKLEVNGQEIDLRDQLPELAEAVTITGSADMAEKDIAKKVEERLLELGMHVEVEMVNGKLHILESEEADTNAPPAAPPQPAP